jgi:hypothetical protein
LELEPDTQVHSFAAGSNLHRSFRKPSIAFEVKPRPPKSQRPPPGSVQDTGPCLAPGTFEMAGVPCVPYRPHSFTISLPDTQAHSTARLDGAMRAVPEPDVAGSSTEVAVTETVGKAGTWEGAVYMPDVEIVPHSAPVQPGPDAVQITRLSSAFWTVTVNRKVQPTGTVGSGGDTVTTTAGRMVILAVADLEVSAAEVALTVTWAGLGTFPGAV